MRNYGLPVELHWILLFKSTTDLWDADAKYELARCKHWFDSVLMGHRKGTFIVYSVRLSFIFQDRFPRAAGRHPTLERYRDR